MVHRPAASRSRRAEAAQRLSAATRAVASAARSALGFGAGLLPGVRSMPGQDPDSEGRPTEAGIVGAEVATWLALSPSLLPRPWWATATNLTAAQGLGHLTASLVWWALRHGGARLPRPRGWSRVRPTVLAAAHTGLTATTLVALGAALRRGRRQAGLVGMPTPRGLAQLTAGTVAGTAGYAALLLIGELTQQGFDRTRAGLHRAVPVAPRWAAGLGALAAVAGAWVLVGDRVVARRVLIRMAEHAEFLDRQTFSGVTRPWRAERSGSPVSAESWESLGAAGRANTSNGPRAADITAVTGVEAKEPVRVFVGLAAVDDASRSVGGPGSKEKLRRALAPPPGGVQAAARRAVAELERTGGLDRRVLVLHCSTGTGWIPDWSVDAVEFLTAGDCAMASMQYTFLPSLLSYLNDGALPRAAAGALFTEVRRALAGRAPEDRPRVFVTGESLGAYGTADAFRDLNELLELADGAVLTGAPTFTRLTRRLTEARRRDTPWRLPVVGDGEHVRFVADPSHLHHDWRGDDYPKPWAHPRVVVAQHASDPISWWGPALFLRRPDWLAEPGARGQEAPAAQRLDVPVHTRWVPLITGWQVAVDMLTCLRVPGGHGHNYHAEFLDYWAAVLGDAATVELTAPLKDRAARWTAAHQRRG